MFKPIEPNPDYPDAIEPIDFFPGPLKFEKKVCDEIITVTRWGRDGLEPGDWVMKGGKNWWNYTRSFKWQPGMGNEFAPYKNGKSYEVPLNTIKWPNGWGIDGAWKGMFGQRRYMP